MSQEKTTLTWVEKIFEQHPEWRPKPPAESPPLTRRDYTPTQSEAIARCVEYLRTVPPGVQGQNGSAATLWAARVVCWGFDLGADVGCDVLEEHYNPRCQPPWTRTELEKKCRDAMNPNGFSKPRGWLLHADAPQHAAARRNASPTDDSAIADLISPPRASTREIPTPGVGVSEADKTSSDAGQGSEPRADAAESTPAPNPPAEPEAPSTLVGVAPDDPCHLARLFIAQPRYQHFDGLKLRHYGQEFCYWLDGAYDRVKDSTIRGEIVQFSEREFIRIHEAAAAIAAANEERGQSESRGRRASKHRVTRSLVGDIMQAVQSYSHVPDTLSAPCWLHGTGPAPNATIVARNGILDLEAFVNGDAGAFIPATPRFLTLNRIGFDFDADAPTPAGWLKFLRSLWPADADSIRCLQEWFGYLLTPDTSLQKMLMLIGPPRAGKGTIGRILKLLVGERNIAAPTLASLADPFGLADLLDKTVAIIADARLSGRADAVAVTEQLLCISGEDPRTINRKFLHPAVTKLNTRFVFFSNELPRFGDSSAAIVSRLVILRLTESFIGREDTGLFERLVPELPGILLWSIDGWDRLRTTRKFTAPETARELIEDAEAIASPVKLWAQEDCELKDDVETAVSELFQSWRNWCERHGRDRPGPQEHFIRDLRAAFPKLQRIKRRDGARRLPVYSGIRVLSAIEKGEVDL